MADAVLDGRGNDMNYRARIEEVMRLRCPNRVERSFKTTHKALLPWTFIAYRHDEHSYEFAYRVPSGYSAQDLKQETDSLAAAVGAPVNIIDRLGAVVIQISRKEFPNVIPYTPDMLTHSTGRSVVIGYDLFGKPLVHDFRVPHMLIGGQSGYGKTDLLRWIIFQLITRFTPEQLHIDIIDGKGFSFLPFRGIPHIRRIVRDLSGASAVMEEGKRIMEKRSDKVWNSGKRDMTSGFQWRLILVDELAVLSPSMQVTKERRQIAADTYSNMAAIACVGREAGVGVIMGTQRPDSNVVHPQVKQNCDVSIALKCKTQTNSEIILDHAGAENLPHNKPGRGIYGGTEDTFFQAPYIGNDDKWNELLEPYRQEETPNEQNEKPSDFIILDELSDYYD